MRRLSELERSSMARLGPCENFIGSLLPPRRKSNKSIEARGWQKSETRGHKTSLVGRLPVRKDGLAEGRKEAISSGQFDAFPYGNARPALNTFSHVTYMHSPKIWSGFVG